MKDDYWFQDTVLTYLFNLFSECYKLKDDLPPEAKKNLKILQNSRKMKDDYYEL